MRTCASCGREDLSDSALLCPHCGRLLDDESLARSHASHAPATGESDPGAAQPAMYACGHEVRPNESECCICGIGAEQWSVGVETPWGLVAMGREPLYLGRDPGFSPHAAELARWDNVSRRHAVIRPTDGGVLVEDLYSANGTFVGDLKLASGESQIAAAGTEIKLGSDPPLILRVVEA